MQTQEMLKPGLIQQVNHIVVKHSCYLFVQMLEISCIDLSCYLCLSPRWKWLSKGVVQMPQDAQGCLFTDAKFLHHRVQVASA